MAHAFLHQLVLPTSQLRAHVLRLNRAIRWEDLLGPPPRVSLSRFPIEPNGFPNRTRTRFPFRPDPDRGSPPYPPTGQKDIDSSEKIAITRSRSWPGGRGGAAASAIVDLRDTCLRSFHAKSWLDSRAHRRYVRHHAYVSGRWRPCRPPRSFGSSPTPTSRNAWPRPSADCSTFASRKPPDRCAKRLDWRSQITREARNVPLTQELATMLQEFKPHEFAENKKEVRHTSVANSYRPEKTRSPPLRV